jgi:hypothetical protein
MPDRSTAQYTSASTTRHVLPQLPYIELAERITRMRDDEQFDLDADVLAPAAAKLRAHYAALLTSADAAQRELAMVQLRRLNRQRDQATRLPEPAQRCMSSLDLAGLVESVVGPLRRRSNGTLCGPCAWHSSKSGTCLVIWPSEGRWWCSSCRRSGDALAWLMLTSGLSYTEARKQLGLPAPRPCRCHAAPSSPPRHSVTLPDTWRPSAATLPEGWHPADPLPDGCRP